MPKSGWFSQIQVMTYLLERLGLQVIRQAIKFDRAWP